MHPNSFILSHSCWDPPLRVSGCISPHHRQTQLHPLSAGWLIAWCFRTFKTGLPHVFNLCSASCPMRQSMWPAGKLSAPQTRGTAPSERHRSRVSVSLANRLPWQLTRTRLSNRDPIRHNLILKAHFQRDTRQRQDPLHERGRVSPCAQWQTQVCLFRICVKGTALYAQSRVPRSDLQRWAATAEHVWTTEKIQHRLSPTPGTL